MSSFDSFWLHEDFCNDFPHQYVLLLRNHELFHFNNGECVFTQWLCAYSKGVLS